MRLRNDLDFFDTVHFTATARVATGATFFLPHQDKETLAKIAFVDSVLNAQQSILTLR